MISSGYGGSREADIQTLQMILAVNDLPEVPAVTQVVALIDEIRYPVQNPTPYDDLLVRLAKDEIPDAPEFLAAVTEHAARLATADKAREVSGEIVAALFAAAVRQYRTALPDLIKGLAVRAADAAKALAAVPDPDADARQVLGWDKAAQHEYLKVEGYRSILDNAFSCRQYFSGTYNHDARWALIVEPREWSGPAVREVARLWDDESGRAGRWSRLLAAGHKVSIPLDKASREQRQRQVAEQPERKWTRVELGAGIHGMRQED